ncbi:nuclear transport factor 2 family protein [Konateibacter massiliensis]|uniref:nuclear transport factor 2 family protein n=1 Tax=Konateibacter massiliensis TaxID=2002841 RepID=UPI000C14BE6B|nr:nuclear transport factor 2 family protein [Konateibacter massiliensis]
MSNLQDPQLTASQTQSVQHDYIGAVEVLKQVFEIFQTGNLRALTDLIAEDAVMEFPYAPPKRPRRVEGKDNIIKYNKAILNIVKVSDFTDVEIHCTVDPDCAIVEMTGHGTVLATGDTFSRRYIDVCRTENGRIQFIRDYWNPQESPKLNFFKKLKVAYHMMGAKFKSRRNAKSAG